MHVMMKVSHFVERPKQCGMNIHILLTSLYRLSIVPVGRSCLCMKTIYDISLNQMVCMPDGVKLFNNSTFGET